MNSNTNSKAPAKNSRQLAKLKTIAVISHTHWDREWYATFQQYRMRLVRLIDKLLDILQTQPDYAYFMLDGQTVILEDYLEVQPSRKAQLRDYIQTGRILVGPWYVLPDQFLISGEAHIQNLLRGQQIARNFGASMPVGYIPDPFGHIGQMPQILKGFGLESAAMWRGIGPELGQLEFIWEAPDGSSVEAIHLAVGYNTGLALNAGVEPALVQLDGLKRELLNRSVSGIVPLMNGNDHAEPSPELSKTIETLKLRLAERGQAVEFVHTTLPQYFEMAREHLVWERPETPHHIGEFRNSQLAFLLPGVLSTRMWIKQVNNKLETLLERWAGPHLAWWQSLSKCGEGHSEGEYQAASVQALYKTAWKYLLLNDPHDSICGCSIDQVHQEMKTRYSWIEQIGSQLRDESLRGLARTINTANLVKNLVGDEPALPIIVFNPTAANRSDSVLMSGQVVGSLLDFVIVDTDGTILPHQVLSQTEEKLFSMDIPAAALNGMAAQGGDEGRVMGYTMAEINLVPLPDDTGQIREVAANITALYNSPAPTDPELMKRTAAEVDKWIALGVETFKMNVSLQTTVKFQFVAPNIPANGYKTFVLHARRPDEEPAVLEEPQADAFSIENEFYELSVARDTNLFTVRDKETGVSYGGLHAWRDLGDAGDEYNYAPPAQDKLVDSLCANSTVKVVRRGIDQSLVINGTLNLPEALSSDRQQRADSTVPCPLTLTATLTPGVKRIDFKLVFQNLARDHRLQVLFPAPFVCEFSEAEGTFDVIQRPLALPKFNSKWLEDPQPTAPQKSFVSVANTDRTLGLTLFNQGLPEYEILPAKPDDKPEVTIALTLLRAVGWLSREDLSNRRGHAGPALETPEAQMLGLHSFHYSLMPHKDDWLHSGAQAQAHAFNTALEGITTAIQTGSLPAQTSFVEILPKTLALSTVKPGEDGQSLIVRLWNPTNDSIPETKLRFYRQPAKVVLSNLAETEDSITLEIDSDGWFVFPVGAKKIITLKASFEK
jgi:alpha-mannosidase